MSNTDRDWQRWGEIDPYYAVASVDQYRRSELSSHLDAFFEEGELYISERLSRANELFALDAKGEALDFGCGVGRLVIPLARRFDRVVGVDISEAMLRECRGNLARNDLTNVELCTSVANKPDFKERFTFVNSYVVLQHIPVDRGMAILASLLQAVRIGGVINLQLTIDRADGAARSALYWAQRVVPGVNILVNLARRRRLLEPLVQMNEYPLSNVVNLFIAEGFSSVDILHERQGRILSVQLMAQKLNK